MTGDVVRDLRLAARGLRRAPAFTFAATVTLALGIGSATAIVSAVDAILIHPLPYADQDRLVAMWQIDVKKDVAATALLLAGVVLATGLVTARRAAGVDPMVALRHE